MNRVLVIVHLIFYKPHSLITDPIYLNLYFSKQNLYKSVLTAEVKTHFHIIFTVHILCQTFNDTSAAGNQTEWLQQ